MSTRGVNQHGVSMVTKCWLGEFRDNPELRRELMESIGCHGGSLRRPERSWTRERAAKLDYEAMDDVNLAAG